MNIQYLKKLFNYKLVEFQKKLQTTFVFGYPYWLTIDPSSACNLACVLCPTGQKRGTRPNTLLSFEDYKKIIDKLGPYLLHIDFCNWGEPLLNKQTAKMIAYTKMKYQIEIKLDTNLNINLTKEEAFELIGSGIDCISASIDGASQKTYEIYRKDGDFEKAIKNLELLVKAKKELNLKTLRIHWQFLVFKHNEHEIEKARKMSELIGVDSIGFTAPFCGSEWVSNIDEYNRYKTTGEKREFRPVKEICNWLWDGIAINSDASVSPCCSVEEKKDDFYDFFKQPFFLLWNGKKYRDARKHIKQRLISDKTNICTICDHIGASNHAETNFKKL